MNIYNPKEIEQKWQKRWKEEGLYEAKDFIKDKEKFYHLVMFPYPSGDLHIGHWYNFVGADVAARKKMRDGYNVMSPIGFDAFGLPAENAAIKRGIHPKAWTYSNMETMREQLRTTGAMFDWSREVVTCDSEYYRWTQWMFLKMYERGLAYRKKAAANWCPKDQTVLANEQVVEGKCERCGTEVVQKEIDQWLFKITDYADKLLNDLGKLDWPEKTKTMQKNWIGRSEGAVIKFKVQSEKLKVTSQNLKFDEKLVSLVLLGEKYTTYRLNDKKFKVGDICEFINLQTGQKFADAKITKIENKKFKDISEKQEGHEKFKNRKEFYKTYENYYKTKVDDNTDVWLYYFELIPDFIEVFTTRADTLFGATYLVLAPEHSLVQSSKLKVQNYGEVEKYVEKARKKTELERLSEDKDKTGVELKGVKAVNPANGEEISVWISDYVLASYGTGAIMAVPAHDERDFEFAKRYELPILPVVFRSHIQSKSIVFGMGKDDLESVGARIIKEQGEGIYDVEIPFDALEQFQSIIKTKMKAGFWNEHSTKKGFHFIFKHINGRIEEMDLNTETNEKINTYGYTFNDEKSAESRNVYTWPSWLADDAFYKNLLIHTQRGCLINSGKYDGMDSETAKRAITEFVGGEIKTMYKLRDWLISRQRYWGVPIPIIHCDHCGIVPVKESDLPVELPEVENYLPKEGQSPLARSEKFVNAKCPQCGKDAKRETDTMDTFVCSSWYFFRYADSKNEKEFASKKNLDYWMKPNGVDLYVGGAEHTVLHLLYSRFFTKVLYDAGFSPVDEPFGKMRHQGIILGPDGQKMSKSKGNVVDPDELVKDFGADAVRMYLLFMGPYELGGPWNPRGLIGIRRFLDRVWKIVQSTKLKVQNSEFEVLRNKTIKKVTEDIEGLRFHTAIASMMEYLNVLENKNASKNDAEALVHLLSPFAPHFAEEIWQEIWKNKKSIFEELWPAFDPKKIQEENISIVVQFNGKARGMLGALRGITQTEVEKLVAQDEKLKKYLAGEPKKVIFVKDKLINFVI